MKSPVRQIISSVRRQKPNTPADLIITWLNWRLTKLLAKRVRWAGLTRHLTLTFPLLTNTGKLTPTLGSPLVTGTGVSWPTNDVVNTTAADAISSAGPSTVTPASMSGISRGDVLYCDSANDPEAVWVRDTDASSFTAIFAKPHGSGFSVEKSSLSGLQLRCGSTYPTYTVLAVPAADQLLIDQPWPFQVAEIGYRISRAYVSLPAEAQSILYAIDPRGGRPLKVNVPMDWLNAQDPQRTSDIGTPEILASLGPSPADTMLYEFWRVPVGQIIQLGYYLNWKQIEGFDDALPAFIPPQLFEVGCLAEALQHRVGPEDPYVDVPRSQRMELEYREMEAAIISADEEKMVSEYRWDIHNNPGMGYYSAPDRDIDVMLGNY